MNIAMLEPRLEEHDLESVIQLNFDGDHELFCEITHSFLSEYETLFAELETQAQTQNLQSVHQLAHKLKGLFANFNHDQCIELARKMEHLAETKNAECLDLIAPFKSVSSQVSAQLQTFVKNYTAASSGQLKRG